LRFAFSSSPMAAAQVTIMFSKAQTAKLLTLSLGLLGAASAVQATQFTFTPNPTDLGGLDHFSYYSWGMDFTTPANQTITSATLTIHNIYDYIKEDNDNLFITLLNNAPKGVQTLNDNDAPGNAWAGQGLQIADFNDPQGGAPRNFDLVVNLNQSQLAKLNSQAAMGKMGIGFDPDCHYFNSGIDFKITTAAVPEPATLATLGLGIFGMIRRRRNRSK
jgi:hypothetical protein